MLPKKVFRFIRDVYMNLLSGTATKNHVLFAGRYKMARANHSVSMLANAYLSVQPETCQQRCQDSLHADFVAVECH